MALTDYIRPQEQIRAPTHEEMEALQTYHNDVVRAIETYVSMIAFARNPCERKSAGFADTMDRIQVITPGYRTELKQSTPTAFFSRGNTSTILNLTNGLAAVLEYYGHEPETLAMAVPQGPFSEYLGGMGVFGAPQILTHAGNPHIEFFRRRTNASGRCTSYLE